jgi:hypothetical protein
VVAWLDWPLVVWAMVMGAVMLLAWLHILAALGAAEINQFCSRSDGYRHVFVVRSCCI